MLSLRICFLYILSVASAVIFYNSRNQQSQFSPYSLYNQQYYSYQASQLHPRFFLLRSPVLRALLGLGANGSGSSTFSGISELFGNSSLFNLQFPRVQSCTTLLTGRSFGSCLNLGECIFRNGLPSGICNFGLKTCCISKGSSSIPVASFTKTSQTTSPETFTILRTSSKFCQVRVDFITFNISQVNNNGYCTDGFWTVDGQANINVPVLCGFNDGQHVYLNFNGDNPITMTVVSNNLAEDDWNIKVTQIKCSDTENIAPTGCLQYFPESTGQVQSFNFRNISDLPAIIEIPETYQLSNLDYFVCLGSPSNSFTTITWTKGSGTTNYYFVLTDLVQIIPESFAGTLEVSAQDPDCTTTQDTFDYVEISDGEFLNRDGVEETKNQFCGLGFPDTVSSTTKPFRLHFVSDPFEGTREGSIGFSLSYTLT